MILLKLCAIPLASDPTICMRRARSSRTVSFALSHSRNSRSMALATASPASRTIGTGEVLFRIGRKASNPMMLRTRPGRGNGTLAQPRTPAAVSTSFTGPGGKAVTSGTLTMSGSSAPS